MAARSGVSGLSVTTFEIVLFTVLSVSVTVTIFVVRGRENTFRTSYFPAGWYCVLPGVWSARCSLRECQIRDQTRTDSLAALSFPPFVRYSTVRLSTCPFQWLNPVHMSSKYILTLAREKIRFKIPLRSSVPETGPSTCRQARFTSVSDPGEHASSQVCFAIAWASCHTLYVLAL